MKILRWILFLPVAVAASLVGAFIGYLCGTIFGDTAMQTSAAFCGTVAFVCVASIIAPTRRNVVTITLTSIIALIAVTAFALSEFTTLPPYDNMPARLKVLIPVAQILGSIYSVFGLQRLFTMDLARLVRKINQLGVAVTSFGLFVALLGLIVGVAKGYWFGLGVGLFAIVLGILTWLVPRIRLMVLVWRRTKRWQWSIRVRPVS